MTKILALIITAAILIGAAAAVIADRSGSAAAGTKIAETETIAEDDARWDCRTMGDGHCGETEQGRESYVFGETVVIAATAACPAVTADEFAVMVPAARADRMAGFCEA